MSRAAYILLLTLLSSCVFAQADRVDYDLNNNGLIEINSWADLDEIRNNLDGSSLYGKNVGCPVAGCIGFELTTDLDFDTNQDGILNAQDTYWNNSSGWSPVGSGNTPFTAIFDGQTFAIRNLMMNRSGSGGLFGYTHNATLRRVHLEGELLSIFARDTTGGLVGLASATTIESSSVQGAVGSIDGGAGGLVGWASGSTIKKSYTTGTVTSSCSSCYNSAGGLVANAAENTLVEACFSRSSVSATGTWGRSVGGLIGKLHESSVSASYATGIVSGYDYVGGLVGWSVSGLISGSYSVGKVTGTYEEGGLIGKGSNNPSVIASYWATDASSLTSSAGGSGVTLAQLECPTAANNSICAATALYIGWDDYLDGEGNSYWEFSSASQLPVLTLDGKTYRDTDNDGVFDFQDDFPDLFAASRDSDGDGAIDKWTKGCERDCQLASGLILDQFPVNAAAALDLDLDAKPDAWNSSCDLSCQGASGLIFDSFPADEDNDGIADALDSDTHDVADADADSDGLIEVSSLAQLDAMRYSLAGIGRRLTSTGHLDSSGCPARVFEGMLQKKCIGYELTVDLDLDSNRDGAWSDADSFWNDGQGWQPIGDSTAPFTAVFNGNGNMIRNLYINRLGMGYQGLFGSAYKAVIKQVGLSGPLTSVAGARYVGLLIGNMHSTSVEASYAIGLVKGSSSTGYVEVGGLIGNASQSFIKAAYSSGLVNSSGQRIGGLVGSAGNTTIQASFSTSYVVGDSDVGGLVGYRSGGAVTDSYWAKDVSNQPYGDNGTGISLDELKCPVAANNTDCADVTLYGTWASYLDESSGAVYWDFGSAEQLPALTINGRIFRDSDGDGALDQEDAFPLIFAAVLDTDGDGAANRWTSGCDEACRSASGLVLDQFPNNAAAIVDLDLDNLPDSWASGCNLACQNASGLTLDRHPNDLDNDGIPDLSETNTGYADQNANGLIEVSNLQELDAVRHSLAGHGQRMTADTELDSSGCPPTVIDGVLQRICRGYELIANLNFDTNNDGRLSSADAFWNQGAGWEAIGNSLSSSFTGTFEGNGFVIRNLMINRPDDDAQGLFGYIKGASLKDFRIEGRHVSVHADEYVGGLVGYMRNSKITKSEFHGKVVSDYYRAGGLVGYAVKSSIEMSQTSGAVSVEYYYAGGLVGAAVDSTITGCLSASTVAAGTGSAGGLIGSAAKTVITGSFAIGDVSSETWSAGGLIGELTDSVVTASYAQGSASAGSSYAAGLIAQARNSKVEASYAIGAVTTRSTRGGIIGSASATTVTGSYWAKDSSGQGSSSGGGVGVLLTELSCPTTANNTVCASVPLFTNWNTYVDAAGSPYWDFGNADQLPLLVIDGQTYRDTDGDRVLDQYDDFPSHVAASKDLDADGAPDYWNEGCDSACQNASGLVLDQLIYHASAAIDLDLDGMPEEWNPSCDLSCQSASGLVLDSFPNDVDNDGISDAEDDTTHGVMNAAIGGKALISISTLEQLDAIRYNLAGTGRVLEELGEKDASGCPTLITNGVLQRVCHGYELLNNLDFDTNRDGILDEDDAYFNDGYGWNSIGRSLPFTGVFEGNGHEIRNLMISNATGDTGLFANTSGAEIRNLGLTGPNMRISSNNTVGSLIGKSNGDQISGCYATGAVYSHGNAGGLIGTAENSSIVGSFTTGSVENGYYYNAYDVGGLVGTARNVAFDKVFSTARVTAGIYSGGLVGSFSGQITEAYSVGFVAGGATMGGLIGTTSSTGLSIYWATDESGQNTDSIGEGATLAQLKCPTSPDNSSCAEIMLYDSWTTSAASSDGVYWDFGTANQLPRLVLSGVARGDSDGDSVEDSADLNPLLYAVSFDPDGDGFADAWNDRCDAACREIAGVRIDDFPGNPAASLDSDSDGYPDAWNESCDSVCQQNSRLRLDDFPNNPAASLDADGDGNPDRWNSDCDEACQAGSGLIMVPAPDATRPTIYAVPEEVSISATGKTTPVTLYVDDIVAYDLVDSQGTLVYEASLGGVVLNRDDEGQVQLPAGALDIDWVAIDPAGNRSDSMKQRINVFPQVLFSEAKIITGKPSLARLPISFSGPSPLYPVVVEILWHEDESTGSEGLIGVDPDQLSITIHNDAELAEAALVIPVNNIGTVNGDETLVFEIVNAYAGETEPFYLPIQEDGELVTLTVTESNLAPLVSLTLYQDDKKVDVLTHEGGLAKLAAVVIDPNGLDTHQYEWNVSELNMNADYKSDFAFDPYNLAAGEYTVAVTVTDSGMPLLTAAADLHFEVRREAHPYSSSSFSSSSVVGNTSSSGDSSVLGNSSSISSSSSSSSSLQNNSGAPAGSGSKGGGGSTSLIFLFLLLGFAGLASRK